MLGADSGGWRPPPQPRPGPPLCSGLWSGRPLMVSGGSAARLCPRAAGCALGQRQGKKGLPPGRGGPGAEVGTCPHHGFPGLPTEYPSPCPAHPAPSGLGTVGAMAQARPGRPFQFSDAERLSGDQTPEIPEHWYSGQGRPPHPGPGQEGAGQAGGNWPVRLSWVPHANPSLAALSVKWAHWFLMQIRASLSYL